jgi:murein DD-endopeptidase MepM/ murein hydrolase activator NlpD
MRKLKVLFFTVIGFTAFGQTPVDTVETANGKMIIYSNRTWSYLADESFDGVLNKDIHEFITASDLNFIQTWDNDVCYTSDRRNDLSKLQDTLWLCVSDSMSKGFHIPHPGYVTSRYGYRKGRYHNGIDIGLNTGDTVRAAWSGKIRYAKYNDGGFGNLVIIRHDNGLETFYAHLSKHLVFPNDEVKAGDVIGLGGNTGRSFGPHLHFEVRFYDAPINPEEMIDFANKSVKDPNLFVHKGLFRPGAKPTDYYEGHDHAHEENVAAVTRPVVVKNKYYKIKSGDTLSKIAAKNNTTIAKLCKLNGIRETTPIQIGRNLRIK